MSPSGRNIVEPQRIDRLWSESPLKIMKTELREPEEYFLIGQDDPRLPIYLRYQLFRALEDFAKREQREQVGLIVGRVSEDSDGLAFL